MFANSEQLDDDRDAILKNVVERTFYPLPSYKPPILDGNLYIYKHHDRLVIGGVNFSQLKMASRTERGDVVDIRDRTQHSISLAVYEAPYIELEYKDKYYEIVLDLEYFVGPNDEIDFSYLIGEINRPSMELIMGIKHITNDYGVND